MPIYSIEQFKDGGTVAVWKVTETEDELKDLSSVPDEELEDIELSPNLQRRLERLAVRALLNECLQEKVYLGYEEDNSPYLKNHHCKISISHSGIFVCIYIHENENVGIDLERLTRNYDNVAQRVLNEDEQEYTEDSRYRQRQLCLIWCAKEAIFKLMGERGVDFSKQIEVKKFTPKNEEGKLNAIFTGRDGLKEELDLNYRLFEDYGMVWTSR